MNGLLYAEGGAQISNISSLHKITLSFNKQEKFMFKQILDDLNLKYTIEQNRNFIIQGWNNQYHFFKTFLSKDVVPFGIHNQRRNNALNGFLNHNFTKTMIKYLFILRLYNSLSVKEFSKLLGIRRDSLLSTIRKTRYSKFVNILGKGINRNPFIISITKEGYNFINIINKIGGLINVGQLPFETIRREVITKRQAQTNEKYGVRPEERGIKQLIEYGVINMNKPAGPTSHQVSEYVKNILCIKKAGHSGTLDLLN